MSIFNKWWVKVSIGVLVVLGTAFLTWLFLGQEKPTGPTETNGQPVAVVPVSEDPVEVASGLTTPWSIAVLPDGDLLVSERPGNLRQIGAENYTLKVEGVVETSEGGLHGVVLDPAFSDNSFIYVYHTTGQANRWTNQVVRYIYKNGSLSESNIILKDIPGANIHNGGALAFGPDGKLYISTGDAGDGSRSQSTSSLAGKILRLNSDGSIPADNPFGNEVWSYGHRNPQGIVWDDKGNMWSVEHGRSGTLSGQDELNKILRGANYGWPDITGDQSAEGVERPVIHSGDNTTWAPSGLAYMQGSLYFAGLRGETLYRAVLDEAGGVKELKAYFVNKYGRLRAVGARDDTLYFGTSNRDGRGRPVKTDDRVFKVQFAR